MLNIRSKTAAFVGAGALALGIPALAGAAVGFPGVGASTGVGLNSGATVGIPGPGLGLNTGAGLSGGATVGTPGLGLNTGVGANAGVGPFQRSSSTESNNGISVRSVARSRNKKARSRCSTMSGYSTARARRCPNRRTCWFEAT